jgi:hypothetical protein
MLVKLSMVEQRYQAVREVLDAGAKIINVAARYGVDRRTVHQWPVRYATEGLGALADKGSKPDRCPHQIAPEVEALIASLRRAHPGWGRAPSSTNLDENGSWSLLGQRSTAAWCVTVSSTPSRAGAGATTTSAGRSPGTHSQNNQ